MKLTKTEAILIERAKRTGGRTAAESCSGRGPEGGRVSHGRRETGAIRSLIEKGIMTQVSYTRTALPDGGYTIWVNTIVARLAA